MILVEATISSLNDTTEWIKITHANPYHTLDASIAVNDTWDGQITLQKTNDGGENVRDVKKFYTDDEFQIIDHVENVQYRFKCTSYSAGEADVELYK